MHGIGKQHRFVNRQSLQQAPIAFDERTLRGFIQFARDHLGLVIPETEAPQHLDQPGATFIGQITLRLDPAANLAGRARQCLRDPGLEISLLLRTHPARAAACIKGRQPINPVSDEQAVPRANRIVIKKQRVRYLRTTPTRIQKHNRVRTSRNPSRRRSIPRHRLQVAPAFNR